jgi:hypothetical protein
MSAIYTELGFALDAHKFAVERLAFEADPRQKVVLQSSAHRMLLNCTRQWGKSTVCGIKALHRALTIPEALVIVAGPAERQSGEFLRKIQMLLHALDIKPRGDGYNSSSLRLPNGSRILGLPGRMHKTIRGFSALSLLIVDEAAQVSDELYAALRPMLATSSGDLWLLSTPYGKQGFFYREWTQGGDRWTRFSVPATECPRIPAEFLEEEREVLGERYFHQEYMCQFYATDDALFEEDAVRRAVSADTAPLFPNGI